MGILRLKLRGTRLMFAGAVVFFAWLPVDSFSQNQFTRIRETNPNYEQGDWQSYAVARFITSIAVGERYVYFGTQHSGITRYHQFKNSWDFPWTTSNGLADNEVTAVAYDFDTGFLWSASRTAVSSYNPTAKEWRNTFKDEFGLPFSDEVESIGISQDKIFFETRARRLFEANKFGGIIVVSNVRGGNALSEKNIRWFGRRARKPSELPHFFMSAGYLFNPEGFIEDPNFRRAEISTVVEDDWGNIWLGTWGLGAGKGSRRAMRLQMLDFGLANNTVNSIGFYDSVLWVGGSNTQELNQGITAWDLRREDWRYYEQRDVTDLLSDQVNSIAIDGNNIWFCTDYGLTRFSTKEQRWKTIDQFDGLADNFVFDAVFDDSTIYVGTGNGISRIMKSSLSKEDTTHIERLNPGNLTIVEVRDLELMENLLWAATNEGIYVYDTAKREGGFSAEIGGPTSERITSISRYGNELWFGSFSGIDVYDVEKREWLGVPEGRFFPNRVIRRVLADKNVVWAASDEGVLKFDRESRSWRTFTIEDGLISNRVNAILLAGDYIWFGTDHGLTKLLIKLFRNSPTHLM